MNKKDYYKDREEKNQEFIQVFSLFVFLLLITMLGFYLLSLIKPFFM